MSSAAAIEQLKRLLGDQLCSPEQVKAPEGVATGFNELDRYLLWHGLPKGALSLFSGALGTGATSLWIEAAARTVQAGKWVAWVNNDVPLSPLPLHQKGVNLGHFVSIQLDDGFDSAGRDKNAGSSVEIEKQRSKSLFFILQELLSSSLFELVGCDLGHRQIKEHQLRKLQTQARDANVALVLLSQSSGSFSARKSRSVYRGSAAQVFSLILQFEKKQITVERALHRQTPHRFPRSVSYARFTSFANQFASPELSFGSHGLEQIEHSRSKPDSLLETQIETQRANFKRC